MRDTIRDIYDAVDDFSKGMGRRRITTFSAACAYYLFVSLVPMIMLLVSLLRYTPLTEAVVLQAVSDYVPDQLYTILETIVNSIYCYRVVFIVLLLISRLVRGYGGEILQLLYNILPHGGAVDWLFGLTRYLRYIVVIALLALVFSFTYWRMPARSLPYRAQWTGAAFCAVSWSVFSFIFSAYVSVSNQFGAYGVIGTVMVAMIWVYYFFYFLLLGGYKNHFIAQKKREGR